MINVHSPETMHIILNPANKFLYPQVTMLSDLQEISSQYHATEMQTE